MRLPFGITRLCSWTVLEIAQTELEFLWITIFPVLNPDPRPIYNQIDADIEDYMSKILSDNLSQELVSKESMAEDLAVEIKSLGMQEVV